MKTGRLIHRRRCLQVTSACLVKAVGIGRGSLKDELPGKIQRSIHAANVIQEGKVATERLADEDDKR